MDDKRPRFISKPLRDRNQQEMRKFRTEVYERDNYTCQYCQNEFARDSLTLEHVVPVSKGGIDDPTNYITACRSCNSSKSDEMIEEFLSRRGDLNINPTDLPIHGDIILDTVELPPICRKVRFEVYTDMRKSGELSGSDAYKKLEKNFRKRLWQTEYGETLDEKYPSLPRHALASVPLVEYLEPDKDSPVHNLLIEFTKSARTRQLIDEIVRRVDAGDGVGTNDAAISVIQEELTGDESTTKRIRWALDRAGITQINGTTLNLSSDSPETGSEGKNEKSTDFEESSKCPVSEGERYEVEIISKGEKGDGIAKIEGYVLFVKETEVGDSVTIKVNKTTPNFGFATRV
ncbi:HNH endonuclease [Salinibaculum rarum]|uniref:HNH endonuclease n=1 Tax=Salinibaculum rarum TaxID=3058903 RepID=UPI00265DD7CF|nr:HNH endonuclease [Salinibaculum sp. KK48]